ncbi:MAG: VanW family protein [Clostridiales bacterium]|nr:VanW family protein [Clostridiales bacterium]
MVRKHTYGKKITIAACFVLCLAAFASYGCGKTTAQAMTASARAHITVRIDDKTYEYRDTELTAPDHTVYEQIERRNINAPLAEKIKTVDKCLAAGAQWREAIRYAFPLLPDFVQKIKTETDREAINSEIAFAPDSRPMFRISRSQDGRQVDERRLYQDIYLALRKSPEAEIVLTPQIVRPSCSVEDNIKLTKPVSTFTTSFAASAEGRKNNIRIALGKINGTVLRAGEEFSFNERVGARTEKNGFSIAKIIVGGEYTEGVGGGVCQASTTVYNAALTAGMRITAARNHSILPSYVPPSLDAMVNASSSDLRFVNPYDTPVFIKAETLGDRARVTFYGAELPYTIKTVSREISRKNVPQDKELIDTERKYVSADSPAGTRVRVSYGHPEVKSEAYLRYFTPEGALIREEKIRTDTYCETQGIIAVLPE